MLNKQGFDLHFPDPLRLDNFTCVCWPFIFLSYKEWFHIFNFFSVGLYFYKIFPEEDDVNSIWLPGL